jgi:hypothetical protein
MTRGQKGCLNWEGRPFLPGTEDTRKTPDPLYHGSALPTELTGLELSNAGASRAGRRIRTSVGLRRQIYSLLPLAARTSRRTLKPRVMQRTVQEWAILVRPSHSAQWDRWLCPGSREPRPDPVATVAQVIPPAMSVSRLMRSSVGGWVLNILDIPRPRNDLSGLSMKSWLVASLTLIGI